MNLERLADGLADGSTRVQAGERVLENDLHLAPMWAQLACPQTGDIGAVERDVPLVGSSSRMMRYASVDFPQPLSPTIAKVSPRPT